MDSTEGGAIRSVDRSLDSTLESADIAEDLAVRIGAEVGLQEEELHKLGMAVRESIVNAVVHGNRYNSHKKVHFEVWKAKDHVAVTIVDEGNGFNPETVPDPLAKENLLQQSGRGLLLIRAFVDRLEMRRGEAGGTEVKLVKYLAHGS